MAYEKSWQFDTNRAVTATTSSDMGKYILWYYKALLCGHIGGATKGLWTVMGSSDGTTGAMDSVDRWGSSYDSTKMVRGGSNAVPHSWVVLQSPLVPGKTRIYMLLSWRSADYTLVTSISTTNYTGGNVNNDPTNTWPYSPFSQTWMFTNSNYGNFHLNGMLATDGSFIVMYSRDNTGAFTSAFVGCWLGNAKPNDAYPFYFSLNEAAALWGTSSTNDIQNTNYCAMIPPDGSQQSSAAWGAIIPTSGNLPVGADAFDSSFVDLPIWVGSSTTAIRGVRGRLQDILYFPGGANSGTVDSTTGAPTYMIAGNYWIPTNAAPIL